MCRCIVGGSTRSRKADDGGQEVREGEGGKRADSRTASCVGVWVRRRIRADGRCGLDWPSYKVLLAEARTGMRIGCCTSQRRIEAIRPEKREKRAASDCMCVWERAQGTERSKGERGGLGNGHGSALCECVDTKPRRNGQSRPGRHATQHWTGRSHTTTAVAQVLSTNGSERAGDVALHGCRCGGLLFGRVEDHPPALTRAL